MHKSTFRRRTSGLFLPPSQTAWRPIYPWAQTIDRVLRSLDLPTLGGETIYIASDYSGEEKALQYNVCTVLYFDLGLSYDWLPKRNAVRQRYLADGRRMAFKSLNDRQRHAALVPFLDAANSIGGVALTVAVSKAVHDLCMDRFLFERCVSDLGFEPRWPRRDFERMAQVTHLIALLLGRLSAPGQNAYWISDQDNIFANERRAQDTKRLLESFSSHYVQHAMGELGLGTTAIDVGDRNDEDLNSIPDLMCGAVAEVTTAVARQCGGRIPVDLALSGNFNVSAKADQIFSWICDDAYSLRRGVVVIDRASSGGLAAFKFEMLQ